jgi:molybdopterin synthase sulfur carrier subunit
MEVEVRIPPVLRELVGGTASVRVETHDAATVGEVLDRVAVAHPALGRRVRDERGSVRTHVNLFVGDENVRDLSGLDTGLRPGAEISIVAAISGG